MLVNKITASGLLKNVRIQNTATGPIVVAQLTQREQISADRSRCTFTIPVVLHVHGENDPRKTFLMGLAASRPENEDYTAPVVIEGQLSTYFDRRPMTEADRRAPLTRIAIESVSLAQ